MAEEYKTGTLKEIAIGLAEKQDHMVNTLTEEAPIVENVPATPEQEAPIEKTAE